MNIVLTGSSGNVGKFLFEKYVSRGDGVAVISTSVSHDEEILSCAYSDLESWNPFDIDQVIHAGALTPKRLRENSLDEYLKSNLSSTVRVATWAASREVRQFIYISTTSLEEFLGSKNTFFSGSLFSQDVHNYLTSKLVSEIFLSNFFQNSSTTLSILRIGTPIGFGICDSEFTRTLISNVQSHEPTNVTVDLNEFLHFTSLDDLLLSLDYLFSNANPSPIMDLVSSSNSLQEIVNSVSRLLSTSAKIQLSSKLTEPIFTKRDIAKVEKNLGFKLTSLESSLQNYIESVSI